MIIDTRKTERSGSFLGNHPNAVGQWFPKMGILLASARDTGNMLPSWSATFFWHLSCWMAPALSRPAETDWIIMWDQSSDGIARSQNVTSCCLQGMSANSALWSEMCRRAEWLHFAPSAVFKGLHVMSARPPLWQIWLLQFEDLTERSEISWPVNPVDQAFVTRAGWALFGEGLALWEQFKMISRV